MRKLTTLATTAAIAINAISPAFATQLPSWSEVISKAGTEGGGWVRGHHSNTVFKPLAGRDGFIFGNVLADDVPLPRVTDVTAVLRAAKEATKPIIVASNEWLLPSNPMLCEIAEQVKMTCGDFTYNFYKYSQKDDEGNWSGLAASTAELEKVQAQVIEYIEAMGVELADVAGENTQVAALQATVDMLKADAEADAAKIAELQNQLDELKANPIVITEVVTEVVEKIVEVDAPVEVIVEKIVEKIVEIEVEKIVEVEKIITETIIEYVEVEVEVEKIVTEYVNVYVDAGEYTDEQYVALQSELTVAKTTLEDKETTIATLNSTIANLESDIEVKDIEISDLNETIEAKQVEIEELGTTKDNLETANANLTTEKANLEAKLEAANTQINDLAKIRDDARKSLLEAGIEEMETLQDMINALVDIRDSLQAQIDVLPEEFATVQDIVDAWEGQKTQIANYKEALGDYETAAAAFQAGVDSVDITTDNLTVTEVTLAKNGKITVTMSDNSIAQGNWGSSDNSFNAGAESKGIDKTVFKQGCGGSCGNAHGHGWMLEGGGKIKIYLADGTKTTIDLWGEANGKGVNEYLAGEYSKHIVNQSTVTYNGDGTVTVNFKANEVEGTQTYTIDVPEVQSVADAILAMNPLAQVMSFANQIENDAHHDLEQYNPNENVISVGGSIYSEENQALYGVSIANNWYSVNDLNSKITAITGISTAERDAIVAALQKSYDIGYEEGYDDGYGAGYDNGWNDALNTLANQ